MPGLSLGAGAQVRAGSQPAYGTVPAPSTSAAAGFGYAANGSTDKGNGLSALTPNDAGGVVFWWGLASILGLVALYWSLPE